MQCAESRTLRSVAVPLHVFCICTPSCACVPLIVASLHSTAKVTTGTTDTNRTLPPTNGMSRTSLCVGYCWTSLRRSNPSCRCLCLATLECSLPYKHSRGHSPLLATTARTIKQFGSSSNSAPQSKHLRSKHCKHTYCIQN